MFKHEAEYNAPEVLTEEQLETVSGGVDALGNMPICPPPRPVLHTGPITTPQGPIK
jgi:hypothetical protein